MPGRPKQIIPNNKISHNLHHQILLQTLLSNTQLVRNVKGYISVKTNMYRLIYLDHLTYLMNQSHKSTLYLYHRSSNTDIYVYPTACAQGFPKCILCVQLYSQEKHVIQIMSDICNHKQLRPNLNGKVRYRLC